jgi:hypothetical protein
LYLDNLLFQFGKEQSQELIYVETLLGEHNLLFCEARGLRYFVRIICKLEHRGEWWAAYQYDSHFCVMEANPCTEVISDVQNTENITVFFTLLCHSRRMRKPNNPFSFPITMNFFMFLLPYVALLFTQ